ncbi:hypothetical protein PAEPH01_1603 [Pancytospora epiphaga]|nr:hypothetical protein PAEPH01_1603 [Pancytospora epiphaga]
MKASDNIDRSGDHKSGLTSNNGTEKMHKYNCKQAWAIIRVQNANHTVCDDMGRVVTRYHRRHSKDIGITESYIQTIVLKKTLKSRGYVSTALSTNRIKKSNKPN